MTTTPVRRHPLGFLEIAEKPSADALRSYYAERYFQSNQGNYRSAYGPDERAYIETKVAQRARIVDELRGGHVGSMLDVGCGEGFAMAQFQRGGWVVTGLDYSRAGVAAMNPQCLPALVTGDVETLLQQARDTGQTFDLIWLSNVLEHVRDPVGLMNQMHGLLSDGGVLVIVVPNDFSAVQRQLLARGHVTAEFWVAPPDHLSYFDATTLCSLGAATNYRCQRVIADFPIDWFLYHPGSNYVADRLAGPPAHRARIDLENLIANKPIEQVNTFYEAMASLGLGRQITAFFTATAALPQGYACLGQQQFSQQGYSIRSVEPGDIEDIRQWRNAQMAVLRQQREISPAEQVAYFEMQIWPTLAEPQPANLLVAYLLDGQLIGYGGLVHIAWDHRRAEVSFLLDPARTHDLAGYRNDFLNFLQLVKTMAFDDLQLQRLFTETYATRQHHISVLEAAGFRFEGRLDQHVVIDGKPVDSLFHGCLDSYAR